MNIQIHYTNKEKTEMMVYLPEYEKTYFVSITNYDWQLKIMKSPYLTEIEKAIGRFLKENQK